MTVESIDAEIHGTQTTRATMAERREQRRTDLDAAHQHRSALLLAAAEGDAQAMADLDTRTQALAAADLALRDACAVVEQLDAKLATLATDRRTAVRDATRAEMREHATAYLDAMTSFERAAGELGTHADRAAHHANRLEELQHAADLPIPRLLNRSGDSRDWIGALVKRSCGHLSNIGRLLPWQRELLASAPLDTLLREQLAALLPTPTPAPPPAAAKPVRGLRRVTDERTTAHG